MKKLFNLLMIALLTLFFVGCDSSSGSDSSSANSITISHENGVDFSEGKNTTEWEQQDGYAIFWSPTNAYVQGEEYNSGVWYGNTVNDGQSIYIYDAGNVSLDSVKSVDESKWATYNEPMQSLQVGHTYVVKARDGYAKFNVTSVKASTSENTSDLSFSATYQYSKTTNF